MDHKIIMSNKTICAHQLHVLELAQFPMTTLEGGGSASKHTSSRGNGYNLTTFGNPEPGLSTTKKQKYYYVVYILFSIVYP